MGTATFSTEAFAGKVEYRFANENHNKNTVTVISDVFLKRTNDDKNVIGGKAYIQLHYADSYSNLIYGDYLGIPYDGNFHKVGTSIRTVIPDNKTVTATVKGFNSSHTDFNFTASVSIKIPASPEETKVPSTFTLGRSSAKLGDEITITVNKSDDASRHKIRFSWGGVTQSYQYFYDAYGNDLQSSDSDGFSGSAGIFTNTRDLTLRLPLSLANNLISRESDTCVIELITYTDALLINKVKSVQRRELKIFVPPEYKPVISSASVTTLNDDNETVNGWGVTLQRYSKAKAEMSAAKSISGDSTVVKYSISCSNSTKDKSDSAELITSVLTTQGTVTFTFTATDSRGRTDVLKSNLKVLYYDDPVVLIKEVKLVNVETDGTVTETEDGRYLLLLLSPTYAPCGGKNSVTLTAQYKSASGGSYTQENPITLDSDGCALLQLDENFQTDESIRVKVNITDALGNAGFAEGIAQGKSIFLHICNKGKSIGVNTYNFVDNSIKFGLDVYIGGEPLTDYIKNELSNSDFIKSQIDNYLSDYVVKAGSKAGVGIKYTNNGTQYTENIVTWKYEVYKSGKIELFALCSFAALKPYSDSSNYWNYLNLYPPDIDGIVSGGEVTSNYEIISEDATGDSLAIIGKGTENGFNGKYFSFLIQKANSFSSLAVSLNFHIILTPK